MTFYINKSSTLEHNLHKSQMQASPVRASAANEDAKMSKSMKARQHQASPFDGPREQLQPVVRQNQQPVENTKNSLNEGSKSQAAARLNYDNTRASRAFPVEESSKLNLLIEEYRRENDRCSRRINELQRKLNATANRR